MSQQVFEVPPGYSIWKAAEEAIKIANQSLGYVSFTFNGISLVVGPGYHDEQAAEIYNLKCKIRRIEQ